MPQNVEQPSRASIHTAGTLLRNIGATSLLLLVISCGGGDGNKQDSPPPPVTTPICCGQQDNAKVDTFVLAELKRQKIPGAAVVVLRDNKVVYGKGYGYANVAQSTPATTDQRFQIGSITKQFVAAAVLLLVEDGKISLDDKIGKHLGDVPLEWAPITVRHILAHTSGLPRDLDPALEAVARTHGPYTTEEILTILKGYKPITEPGLAYGYSNVGYDLMGVLIEKVTGKFYGELIQSRIFTPLGMSTARNIDFASLSGNATGYYMDEGKMVPLDMAKMPAGLQSYYRGGSGGIEMSATDLAKWDASLATEKVLKKSSIDLMWTAQTIVQKATDYTINYGLGWFMSDFNKHPKVYHSGGMSAFTTDYLHFTDDKLTVIVLTNMGDPANPETMSRSIAEMYVPGTWPPK